MAQAKPLYLAKSMKELNSMSPKTKLNESNPKLLIKSSEKLYLGAYESYRDGDQERAYVLLLRYMDVLQTVKASKEYKQNKRQFDALIDKSKFKKALEDAESLSKDLLTRYEELNDTKMDSSGRDIDTSTKDDDGDDDKGSENGLIACDKLYELLTKQSKAVLIVDCRRRSHMTSSTVNPDKYPQWLPMPLEIINVGKLTAFMTPNQQKIWTERGKNGRKYAVLVDTNTANDDIKSIVSRILKQDNMTLLVLEGGYNSWYLSYGPLCVGKWTQKDLIEKKDERTEAEIGNFAYPSSDGLIPPKPKTLPSSSTISTTIAQLVPSKIPPTTVSPSMTMSQQQQPTITSQSNVHPVPQNPMHAPQHPMHAPGPVNVSYDAMSNGLPPLLPVAPSVPLPLQLEGMDMLLENDLQPPPSVPLLPSYYLSAQWYYTGTDGIDPYQSYYDPSQFSATPTAPSPPIQQPPVAADHHHQFEDTTHAMAQQNMVYYASNNPIQYSHEPLQPTTVHTMPQTVPEPSSAPTLAVMNSNDTQDGGLHVLPSTQVTNPIKADTSPSQPPAAVPSSQIVTPPTDDSDNGSSKNSAATDDGYVKMKEELEKREKEIEIREKSLIKNEKNKALTEAQIKHLFDEERQKLDKEREEMKLLLQKEREKDKAELEELKIKTQKEMQEKIKELSEKYDRERASMIKDQEQMKHYWGLMRQQELSNNRQFVTNQGLPAGWEKRLDGTTGRFYYIDHTTKTTHWNPPTSLLQYQAELQRQQQINRPTPAPTAGGEIPHQIPTMHHVPNKPFEAKSATPSNTSPLPSVARTNQLPSSLPITHATPTKPSVIPPSVPTVNRTSKPVLVPASKEIPKMSIETYRRKMANLVPVTGSLGPGLTGLRNLGNTCFMSSVLQCLFATPPLMHYFVSNRYRAELNIDNPLGSGGLLAEEFFILCRATWVERFKHVSPVDMKSVIGRVAPYFSGTQQHDSQEFLMYFLDGLHEDLNRVKDKKYIEIPDATGIPDHTAAQKAWDIHRQRNNSIIIDLFYGILKSTICCMTCGQRKMMFEPFLSLSVPVPSGCSSCSYTDCLKLFTAVEKLSGDNKWYCPNCKQHRNAEKRLAVWRLPPVLLLHFKRFKDGRGTTREKVTTHISFPLENLAIDQCVVGPKPAKQYNLFGISNHIGNMGSGHYTACCKNAQNGKFYVFNDEDVKAADSRDLSNSSAYLLFYTCENFQSLN